MEPLQQTGRRVGNPLVRVIPILRVEGQHVHYAGLGQNDWIVVLDLDRDGSVLFVLDGFKRFAGTQCFPVMLAGRVNLQEWRS